jgi:hypothetical protein
LALEDGVDSAANIAGYWTIGVAQGTLKIIVPFFVVGMAAGFLRKLIQISASVGGK